MIFICYPKCSTCQKARKWLEEHGIKYTERHIVEQNPSYEELKVWYGKSGFPFQYQRSFVQGNAAEGEASRDERRRAVKVARHKWHVGETPAACE